MWTSPTAVETPHYTVPQSVISTVVCRSTFHRDYRSNGILVQYLGLRFSVTCLILHLKLYCHVLLDSLKLLNVILRHSSFPHWPTSTFSTFEVF